MDGASASVCGGRAKNEGVVSLSLSGVEDEGAGAYVVLRARNRSFHRRNRWLQCGVNAVVSSRAEPVRLVVVLMALVSTRRSRFFFLFLVLVVRMCKRCFGSFSLLRC